MLPHHSVQPVSVILSARCVYTKHEVPTAHSICTQTCKYTHTHDNYQPVYIYNVILQVMLSCTGQKEHVILWQMQMKLLG